MVVEVDIEEDVAVLRLVNQQQIQLLELQSQIHKAITNQVIEHVDCMTSMLDASSRVLEIGL